MEREVVIIDKIRLEKYIKTAMELSYKLGRDSNAESNSRFSDLLYLVSNIPLAGEE